MNIEGIQSAMVGMALFDLWDSMVRKSTECRRAEGSPMVAAAAAAFEQYVNTVETQMGAQILGLSTYALRPDGQGANLMNAAEMAPFYALNMMA
jgi:hypothetical protein